MAVDASPESALMVLIDGLRETRRVEFEIISGNRARYQDMLFNFDIVVGYARDLRLIEYHVRDIYAGDTSRKTIIIYPYGENDDDPTIIRRNPGDASGHWSRYFKAKLGDTFLQISPRRHGEQGDHLGGSQDHLPPGDSQAELLGTSLPGSPGGSEESPGEEE